MIKESAIVIGAGPCGLAAAIELQRAGLNPLVIE
ncbi:MAG: Pyridine nucleotide-disulfide oxidoreductase, partial [Paenibacillus sp.]|nr:Pyridine nucleotide-disulfide oxidoreductase [Paenibacillus sp.]